MQNYSIAEEGNEHYPTHLKAALVRRLSAWSVQHHTHAITKAVARILAFRHSELMFPCKRTIALQPYHLKSVDHGIVGNPSRVPSYNGETRILYHRGI